MQCTNVVQLRAMLAEDPKQVVYYQVIPSVKQRNLPPHILFCQAGIGTSTDSAIKTFFGDLAAKLVDKALAISLGSHVQGISFPSRSTILKCLINTPAGYTFLMENCQCTAFGPFTLLLCPIRSP